ncbi:MAG: family 4 glycosyl hydrolase, partial [Promethearchaeota archaeon]
MTERKRFVYIGAGSFRFSIVLFSDFGRATELSPMDVWLVDIDEKSLNLMYKVFKNMAKKAKKKTGVDIRVFKTLSRREALENADFVYKSISVGIQEAEF